MATSAIQFRCGPAYDCQQRNLQLTSNFYSCQLKLATSKSLSFSTSLSQSFFAKGFLSKNTLQRSNHDVVCMARRYAPNSSLRKKLSRKRGGDRLKKNKRRRKRTKKRKGRAGKTKKKKEFKIVRLVSAAGTGVFYAKKKSRQIKEKLKFRKYDPQVQQHVLFEEVK